MKVPVDAAERETALDTSRSFLVRAPAGSGKTELLIHRFLKLLAEVEQPEQVLAITFTVAATAEMRNRILDALRNAAGFPGPSASGLAEVGGSESSRRMAALAAEALENDRRRGWRLLDEPQRLNIRTIDSLCLSIVKRTPLLSRLGGILSPTANAEPFYHEAARRTLSELGGSRSELSSAIEALLAARDSRLEDCENLIAEMLKQRDRWGWSFPAVKNAVSGAPDTETEDSLWRQVKTALEAPFVRARERLIVEARELLMDDAAIRDELVGLIDYACGNLDASNSGAGLLSLRTIDPDQWLANDSARPALCGFLLTNTGKLRARVTAEEGFPGGHPGKAGKQRFSALIEQLSQRPGASELLSALREIPPAEYSPEQWKFLKQILIILRHAMAELRVIFSREASVDFLEITMAAREALRGFLDNSGDDSGDGSESAVFDDWRHLLVDEFQDTSRAQYELLELVIRQWEQDGERHSCFFVGDPTQSIYGFRDAEVELFDLVGRNGIGSVHFEDLSLKSNFRSHAGLVSPLNEIFARIFGSGPMADGGVGFTRSEAVDRAPEHAALKEGAANGCAAEAALGDGHRWVSVEIEAHPSGPGQAVLCRRREAVKAVQAIERILRESPRQEGVQKDFRIGVLVRNRNDVRAIAGELRHAKIPFHAVEMEGLDERQEILDLQSLARALLHPMDRIAWLSVLRAPWCGLSLADLHTLSGADDPDLSREPMLQLLRSRQTLLTPEGSARVARIRPVLEDGIRGLANQPVLARWLERVWRALGGPATVNEEQWENIHAFLNSIRDMPPGGAGLEEKIQQLLAEPDPATSEAAGVQLMTIHKAKGLAFDAVVVPGLHSRPGTSGQPLLLWLERTVSHGTSAGQRELLVCPIGEKGRAADALYQWIVHQRDRKEREESKRLFYVAATRARRELLLMGDVTVDGESIKPWAGGFGSLLRICWEGLGPEFLSKWQTNRLLTGADNGQSSGRVPPAGARPSVSDLSLRRLPAGWSPPWAEADLHAAEPRDAAIAAPAAEAPEHPQALEQLRILERPHGALESRAIGVAVHALLEELALEIAASGVDPIAGRMDSWEPRALALLRSQGLPPELATKASGTVIAAIRSVLADEAGRWILGPHPGAEAEISWSQWEGHEVVGLRGDRVFRAGAEPLATGETHQWIVDYKTAAHAAAGLDEFLKEQKELYTGQLAAYGKALRGTGNILPLRLALYYPLLQKLLWWNG